MEETPVTGHRKRDRRQAVLNSQLLKEIMDSGEEEESEKDDQEDERPKKRAHTAQKQARAGREGEKESTAKTKKQSKAAAAEKGLENESLIEIIKHKGKYVDVAAMQWLERYEANTVDGLNELLLTLFEACGVTLDLQEESYTELDVDDVVKEMLSQAKQGAVEDYLGSKQKDVRNFKDNLLTFWDILVRESQEGPLFDQQLMEKCMDYVIALSCTPPRVFRHVATRIGLQLVTSFVAVAKTLGQARETAQRQLNAETKKRKEGARIESLNKQLSEKHEKITMVEEMMRRIFTGVFMHRYRDVDPEIRQACISAMGSWVVSYPSLFLQDLYLKYIGWTLNDKNPAVRKSSISALQALYAVDDHVPSLSLFTARFCNRMVEMADDVDMTVAVNAIGLLKQLLKHELLTDEDQLGSVYDLLIDEAPQIRHAVGDLVYEHMISRPSEGQEDEDLSGQLERLLRIVNAFSADSTLCDYVIDALWDRCQAMKDWKCMTTMLLEDPTQKELNDQDTNNLVRVLSASVKKAVGEKIVPSTEHRKPHSLNKAQKEAQETRKKDMTSAMVNSHAKLLRKYLADNTKVAAIVEIIMYMQLGHYSFMRQEQNFTTVLQLIKEAFFKHGDENTLKSCIKGLAFAANESQADLQDSANQILKETADDLLVKVRSAITRAGDAEDDYSLTVNLRRLYQLQLVVNVSNNLFTDLQGLLDEYSNLGDEVIRLVLLNMFLHLAWALRSIDLENPDDASIKELLAKRTTFMEHLQVVMDSLLDSWGQGTFRNMLTCTMCAMLSDLWSLFSKAKLAGTRLRALGFCPSKRLLQQFWKLCENRLAAPDGSEEEVTDEPQASEYLNEKDAVVSCAAKLIAHEMVPKEYLGPEILSHYVLHGKVVAETVKQLLVHIKKHSKLDELSSIYSDAMKRAYERHLEDVMGSDEDWTRSQSFVACKDLGNRLAGTFFGFQRKEFRPSILGIVRGGIAFAFTDAPKQLSFLETGVIQFALKLPSGDIKEVLAGIEQQVDGIDTDADPNGWRPYFTFVEGLREKIARTEPENGVTGRPPRTGRKKRDLKGKRLFENPETSSGEEDSLPPSESEEAIEEDDDDDDDTPLFQVRQTMRRSALPARGSQLRPPPVPKVLVADTRKPIEQATPSFVDTPEEEEEEEKGDSPGTLERGSLSSDDPIMMGSATEEQLPAYPRGAAQDSSVTYSSTEETRQTGNNVRSKRPVSFSSDEEEDLNMEKRTRRDQDTDSMET